MKTPKIVAVVACVLAAVAAGQAVAAPVGLTYVGAFRAVNAGHYDHSLAFVPGGTNADRPGGLQVNVPTLLTVTVGHSSTDYLKEWYIPADGTLATTSGASPPSASQVLQAAGGTYIENTGLTPAGMTLMNGRMYGEPSVVSSGSFYGELNLGTWNAGGTYPSTYLAQNPTVPAGGFTVGSGGIATKYDTANTIAWMTYTTPASSGLTYVYVNTALQGAMSGTPGRYNWTTANAFHFTVTGEHVRTWPMTYAVLGGTGYYLLYNGAIGNAGNATLDFYDATVFTGGIDATVSGPTFSLDIDTPITNGFNWNSATSTIEDMAYDPSTGRLYVIENSLAGGRSGLTDPTIHILQLTVPEPATMAFLAVGGLGLIGAAVRRRRSA